MSDSLAQIRNAILEAIPQDPSNYGAAPNSKSIYIPPAHLKALGLQSSLVVGARGVGKSFWTAALGSPTLRSTLGSSVRELECTQVAIGFGGEPNIENYPDGAVFKTLLAQGFTPYEIWCAVVLRWLNREVKGAIPTENWPATTKWVKEQPEQFARLMQSANEYFIAKDQNGLIVFDALDRSSNNWQTMDTIVRDLLRVVLWLKSYPAIHAKVFLRGDQYERTVTNFPDASKLIATKAELTWQPHDLHGLLWQLLCNAPNQHGEKLRDVYASVIGNLPSQRDGIWVLDDAAKREGIKQRALFAALAGPWMGKGPRRGVPYVWSVSHLADGNGRTSPRSFLAAIRAAAEDSAEKHTEHNLALHYESIKRGVQKASGIRIAEMAEDYPWVKDVFEPLKGLTVPCEFPAIEELWKQKFPEGFNADNHERLPPQDMTRGWVGVREDLERLGLFETKRDSRINMPDLYRVGFGLGRRGGVKPMK